MSLAQAEQHAEMERKLAFVLKQVESIAEGIDDKSPATRETMANIKMSLLSINRRNKDVTKAEIGRSREIYDFMLPNDMEQCLSLWFDQSCETDDKIWSNFSDDVSCASMGLYEHWSYAVDHPHMIVALAILLDQFPRKMYRGTKGMYSSDKMCCKYVKRAMRAGIDKKLSPRERIFLLLVLTHSEDVEDQHLCLQEYMEMEEGLSESDPLRVYKDIFFRHVALIDRFGRFPHRNSVYQRENTREENAFLADSLFRFNLPVVKNNEGKYTFFRDGKSLWQSCKRPGRERRSSKVLKVSKGQQRRYSDSYSKSDDDDGCQDEVQYTELFYDDPDAFRIAADRQNFIRIGDLAPNFSALSTKGTINLYEYLGNSWGILFSHPKDFTPVCTTELGRAAQLQEEFDKRDVKLLGVSTDRRKDHERWIRDINHVSDTSLDYPLLDDRHKKICAAYGMLDQTKLFEEAVRSVFVISPDKKVALIITYPMTTGRNFDEILRAVDALQTNWDHGVATPVDWERGERAVILPFYSDEEAWLKFGQFEKKTSYLRYIPDPGADTEESKSEPHLVHDGK